MHIFTFANHKGGVGKSTTVLNVGTALSRKGKKVLLIDLDPQANLTVMTGLSEEQEFTIFHVLKGEQSIADIALPLADTISIVPSGLDLSVAETVLLNAMSRETILSRALHAVPDGLFDVVLIDCPPSLGILTLNALSSATHVFIPMQAHYLSLKGISKLTEIIDQMKKFGVNPRVVIGGFVITMFDGRETMQTEIIRQIREHYGNTVLQSIIRKNVSLTDAPAFGKDIFSFDKRSRGAEDYLALAEEIHGRYLVS